MVSRNKKLRSGYTTGACAAAAAKAASLILLSAECEAQDSEKIGSVEIPFPDGSRVTFKLHHSSLATHHSPLVARASIIKDAGDDPDVTNGAEIVAEVSLSAECGVQSAELKNEDKNTEIQNPKSKIIIKGGKGVGVITKPGLSMPVGEAAINPVPRKMITQAVMEAISEFQNRRAGIGNTQLEVAISVPEGERLARKTLNSRLGIIGGISILGTTGIVRPLSIEAWTASVTLAMDVAKSMGRDEVVLSSGRASEEVHMKKYNLPVESYVMMGDYLEFSFSDARKHEFRKIHLCSQWAKMLKIAMTTPQTHVRHGAIDMKKTVQFLNRIGVDIPQDREFNTAREILDLILSTFKDPNSAFLKVCNAAKQYAEEITGGIPVIAHLVSYDGDIIVNSCQN